MTQLTFEALSELHANAFAGQGRSWSAEEFASLLIEQNAFVCADRFSFALGRVVADEAELLTIATDPRRQRSGLAQARLLEFEKEAKTRGAQRAFLEVAESNWAAVQLYETNGYLKVATRKDYYQMGKRTRVDAVIMEKKL